MKSVGIKVLKNNLSRYLREVRAGETVLVTDRDEVIAEIHRPTTPVPGRVTRWASWLNDQERSGRIRRAQRAHVSLKKAIVLPAAGTAVDVKGLLDESRRDRL